MFGDIKSKIVHLGTRRGLVAEEKERKSRLLLHPHGLFKSFWNVVMILLLMYTALVVPFKIAFIDEEPQFFFFLEILFDLLFIMDLILNFFSAYERYDGKIEWRQKVVVVEYLFSWFLLDFIACIPF